MAIGTGVGAAETPPVTADYPGAGQGRARRLRIPRSPKVLIGLGLLVFFVLLAMIGPLVAPYDPNGQPVHARTACRSRPRRRTGSAPPRPSRTCCPSCWSAAAARCWWPSWPAWSPPRCRS